MPCSTAPTSRGAVAHQLVTVIERGDVDRMTRPFHRGACRVRVDPSHAAELATAASGHGVTLAIAHAVAEGLDRGLLARVGVAGAPVRGMWYASILASDQTLRAALAVRNFVITPEGTHAALAGGGVPPGEAHPPINITRRVGSPTE